MTKSILEKDNILFWPTDPETTLHGRKGTAVKKWSGHISSTHRKQTEIRKWSDYKTLKFIHSDTFTPTSLHLQKVS